MHVCLISASWKSPKSSFDFAVRETSPNERKELNASPQGGPHEEFSNSASRPLIVGYDDADVKMLALNPQVPSLYEYQAGARISSQTQRLVQGPNNPSENYSIDREEYLALA